MKRPRYIVGIDLGTTNSLLAYVDTTAPGDPDRPIATLVPIPQLTRPGRFESRDELPSFLYVPADGELTPESMALPWGPAERIVGQFARARGAEVPTRVVSSAKSWLCAAGVDPAQPILPFEAPPDVTCLSVVDAQAAYLAHLRHAWDAAMPSPLARQEIHLAVPASFDAAARALTVRAAEQAGLGGVHLVEEPQAAFYAWLGATQGGWRRQVRVGDVILVVDVGGGTTDLSLVTVAEEQGALVLERKAVGDHILLGGDNMDLALGYQVRARLEASGTALDDWQFRGLVHGCRAAKEVLLAPEAPAATPVVLLGRSRKLVAGTVRVDVARDEAEASLVEGFFPLVAADAEPLAARRAGLRQLGLPYAADPAITRHIAAFLARHRSVAPHGASAVLFNGGVMRAARFRARVLEALTAWRAGEVRVLEGADPDRAVALGSALYGLARQGHGVRVRGGTARAYYVGVEAATPAVPGMAPPVKAVCLAPFGLEEGSEVALPDTEFGLVVGTPAEFRLFGSSVRRADRTADVVERWAAGEIEELAPIETTLTGERAGEVVPVTLRAHVTELGTLELWCVARDGTRRWRLEFSVRPQ